MGMEVKCCGNGWERKPCLMGTDGDGYNFCGNGWGWFDFPLPCRSLVPLHRRKKERKKERYKDATRGRQWTTTARRLSAYNVVESVATSIQLL